MIILILVMGKKQKKKSHKIKHTDKISDLMKTEGFRLTAGNLFRVVAYFHYMFQDLADKQDRIVTAVQTLNEQKGSQIDPITDHDIYSAVHWIISKIEKTLAAKEKSKQSMEARRQAKLKQFYSENPDLSPTENLTSD